MEAIGYFRRNAAAGVNEALPSLEEQEAAFFQFCIQQGFQPVATFIDAGTSAPEGQRGYRQLLDYLQQPHRGFMVVVVSRVEELSQDPKEAVRRLLELEYLGARLVATESLPEDLLEEALNFWRRRRSQERLSVRTLDTLRMKAMRGYGLGKTPYGYRIGVQGRLEVVPEEAGVVQAIYQMYVEEVLGLRRIARRLNDQGIFSRRGSRWSVVTVRDILRNRVYVGTYARFGVRVPGSHEAIISQELFRQAQRKREATGGGRPPGRTTAFLLTGLAYCNACNGRMIGVSRRQSWSRKRDGGQTQAEYRYYRCGSRVNQSICDYHTWRARDLEEKILEVVAEHLAAPLATEQTTLGPTPTEVRSSLRSRLKSLDGRFERYLDSAAKGVFSLAGLRTAVLPILRETQHIERRLQELENPPRRHAPQVARLEQQQESAQELFRQWSRLALLDQRLLLRDLLERVVVYDDHVEPVFHS